MVLGFSFHLQKELSEFLKKKKNNVYKNKFMENVFPLKKKVKKYR